MDETIINGDRQDIRDRDDIENHLDIDDDDDKQVGESDLFKSTITSTLSAFDETDQDAMAYYIGCEVDSVESGVIALNEYGHNGNVYSCTRSGRIRSWDIASDGAITAECDLAIRHPARISSCVAIRDRWVIGDASGAIAVLDEYGRQRSSIRPRSSQSSNHPCPILTPCLLSGVHGAMSLADVTCLATVDHTLYSCGHDGGLAIHDIGDDGGRQQHQYSACRCPLTHLDVNPLTRHQIWIGGWDSRLRLIDVRAKDCSAIIHTSAGARSPIRHFQVVDQLIYVAHGDSAIASYDIRSGAIASRYSGHQDVVNRIIVHDHRLISASDDRMVRRGITPNRNRRFLIPSPVVVQIRIFDIVSGSCLDRLCGHDYGITGLVNKGPYLVSADLIGSIRRYDIEAVNRSITSRAKQRDAEKKKAADEWEAKTAMAKASAGKAKKGKKAGGGKKKGKKK